MDKVKIAKVVGKGLISFLTSASVGAVVENAIEFTTPAGLKPYKKVLVAVGKVIISGIVATAATKYVEKEMETFGKIEVVITKSQEEEPSI
jgi:hypothetical protein